MRKADGFKRMFFDIETSPNVVFSWRTGRKIDIGYENILTERAVICICWKWEGERKVHSLSWDTKHNDKKMLATFIAEMKRADEIIGHNSDKFDVRWVRTRCIYHGIECPPDYTTIDTLKLARLGFYFNSNRLDYIGTFLGVGGKIKTGGFGLWKAILTHNCESSMKKMVKYCKRDVVLLEQIYQRMVPYIKHKTHRGVLAGHGKISCPECTSMRTIVQKTRATAQGHIRKQMHCKDCHKYFYISQSDFERGRDAINNKSRGKASRERHSKHCKAPARSTIRR